MFSPFLALVTLLLPVSSAQTLPREELLRQLREDSRVEVVRPDEGNFLLGDEVLPFLVSYFRSAPRAEDPIRLHATEQTGPRLVWRKDGAARQIDLYFAKNAGDGLYGKREQQALPGVETAFGIQRTVEYDQELSSQITEALYSISDLSLILENRYHIFSDCRGVTGPCDSFKKGELIAFLGILEDLPPHITANLKLNRIHRYPDGVSEIPDIRAAAAYSNGVIHVTSRAFEAPGDATGEGTLVHELGHAIWPSLSYGLREAFIALSWIRNPQTKALELLPSKRNFISDYSMSKPEEDFAEHFSAFVTAPELLGTLAPGKGDWMKANVFLDTEYFTSGDPRTRIFVASRTPDTAPPHFLNGLRASVQVENEVIHPKRTRLRIRLQGVVDDLSGVEEVKLEFLSRADDPQDWILLQYTLDRSAAVPGSSDEYLLEQELDRTEYPDRKMFLRTIRLRDQAGNREYLALGEEGISFDLQGTATGAAARKNTLGFENERQRKLRKEIETNLAPYRAEVRIESTGAPGLYRLHLPAQVEEQSVKLESADLVFYGVREVGEGSWREIWSRQEERMTYHLDRKALERGRSGSGLELELDFRRGVNMERMFLAKVALEYRSLDWSIELFQAPSWSKINPSSILEPKSVGSDPTPAEIDLNGMELELQPDPAGGEGLILKTRLPLQGFENGGSVRIHFRTPSGKVISGESLEMKPGKSLGEVEIPLNRYREGGEYQLHEIELMENSPEGANPAIQEGKQFRVQKVSTRGIRKTITVQKAPPAS